MKGSKALRKCPIINPVNDETRDPSDRRDGHLPQSGRGRNLKP